MKTSLVELCDSQSDETARCVLEALIVLLDFYQEVTDEKVYGAWAKLKATILSLGESAAPINLLNCDAEASASRWRGRFRRHIPALHQRVQLSPAVPPLCGSTPGWDLLTVARSEIGSNRKHRGNRFLTVIQYCLDMTDAFKELQRVCKDGSRIVVIVGRECNVRKTRFFNGEIMAALASRCVGFSLSRARTGLYESLRRTGSREDIHHFCVRKSSSTVLRNHEPSLGKC